jgi:hypothetical protein
VISVAPKTEPKHLEHGTRFSNHGYRSFLAPKKKTIPNKPIARPLFF